MTADDTYRNQPKKRKTDEAKKREAATQTDGEEMPVQAGTGEQPALTGNGGATGQANKSGAAVSEYRWQDSALLEEVGKSYEHEGLKLEWGNEKTAVSNALRSIASQWDSYHRYKPVKVLGIGGSGIVLRLEDALFPEQDKALKFPRPVSGKVQLIAEMLRKEITSLSKLRHPGIVRILDYALKFNPCLVLTNATDPLLKRLQEVESLLGQPHPASFRVSLDYSDRKRHDAGRGEGNFDKALQGLDELHQRGFPVSVARQMEKGEDREAVERGYRKVFVQAGLPEDLRIVPFPDFLTPGAQGRAEVPQITQDCMTRYQSAETRVPLSCVGWLVPTRRSGSGARIAQDGPTYLVRYSLRREDGRPCS